jgi:hypothetical protein
MITFEMTGFVNFVQCQEFDKNRKPNILEAGFFPSTGEGRETPSLFGPLKRVNLNHWIVSLRDPTDLRKETHSLSKTLSFLVI